MCTSSCVIISAISAGEACGCSRLLHTTTLSGVGPMTKARALDSAPRLRQGRHCSDNHSVLGGGSESLCVSLASRVVVVVRVDVAAKRCAASFLSTGVLVEDDHCRAEDVTRRNRRLPASIALSLLLLSLSLLLLLPGGSASMIRLAAGTAAAADNAGDAPVSVDTTGIST